MTRQGPPVGVLLLRLRHTLTPIKHQAEFMGESATLAGLTTSALDELERIIQAERAGQ